MNATLLALVAALSACLLTGVFLRVMRAANRLEQPSERGMHARAVPSGAGAAIVLVLLVLWPFWQGWRLDALAIALLVATAGLAALSWIDDHHRLSPAVRFPAHFVAVALMLFLLDPGQRVAPFLSLAVERVLLGFGWLWFINLFNFMDGIDGIAGAEAVAVGVGYVAVAGAAGFDGPLRDLALVLGAASAGYLVWNWHPAKVFMGDTGSIPLGFLLGWLMIDLACRGHWAAAAILPLYFAADATLTLFMRLSRGETPWQAHREHFYQRAVLGGASPPAVVWRVNAVNVALIALALLSLRWPVLALIAAALLVAGLLAELQRLAGIKS
jgi:UDP-N-acetylmuramyl pentapeptide phosphotransferase/UDP-N-acetylglucosamine-1-phosphate transferase